MRMIADRIVFLNGDNRGDICTCQTDGRFPFMGKPSEPFSAIVNIIRFSHI